MAVEDMLQEKVEDLTWIDAEVPGNCRLDLLKQGIIVVPFFGLNTRKIRDMEFYEWWYEKEFRVPKDWDGKRLELLFNGIDTSATIWLNRRLVGSAANMFIPHSIDISSSGGISFPSPSRSRGDYKEASE